MKVFILEDLRELKGRLKVIKGGRRNRTMVKEKSGEPVGEVIKVPNYAL